MKKIREASGQFARFLVVGGFATLFNYATFYALLVGAGFHYQLASAIGFLFGIGIGYPLNKLWTYRQKGPISHKRKIGYLAVYLGSLTLSLVFLYVTVDLLDFDARMANILAIGLTTCTNFIGTKFLVFRI